MDVNIGVSGIQVGGLEFTKMPMGMITGSMEWGTTRERALSQISFRLEQHWTYRKGLVNSDLFTEIPLILKPDYAGYFLGNLSLVVGFPPVLGNLMSKNGIAEIIADYGASPPVLEQLFIKLPIRTSISRQEKVLKDIASELVGEHLDHTIELSRLESGFFQIRISPSYDFLQEFLNRGKEESCK